MAKCQTTPDGILLNLHANEVAVLRFLGRELRRLLENGDPDQGILKPFYPAQQRESDPESVGGDLDMAMDIELLTHRLHRIESVQDELLGACDEEGLVDVFDETHVDIWLAYLTDLRLLVATVIGITPEDPDPMDEDPEQWTMEEEIYGFLSMLQEGLLHAIQGDIYDEKA
jgi:hypothetical protein